MKIAREKRWTGVVSSVYPVREEEGGGVEAKTRVTEQGDRPGGSLL